jgi:parvulin-like peptidyl-prolyl isomerase
MDRRLSIGVGAAVLLVAALFVWRMNTKRSSDATRGASAAVADASVTASFDAGLGSLDPTSLGSPSGLADAAAILGSDSVAGTRLPDGSPVPPLPEKSPKSVKFGVVLVTYAGAQGAPPTARPKREALELAKKLAIDAKTDFKGAVVRGDSGSLDDLGRVPRNVLEPAPEYVLFTMAAGGVSEPIDTPRGFWIVKRLE